MLPVVYKRTITKNYRTFTVFTMNKLMIHAILLRDCHYKQTGYLEQLSFKKMQINFNES